MAIYLPHKKGQQAEEAACLFLTARGLGLLAKNFRTRLGEIDLIMQDGETIVFIEVRSRSRQDYGDALDSIDDAKIKRLEATATLFLQQQNWLESKTSRFDVIAIDLIQQQMQFKWVKNAF